MSIARGDVGDMIGSAPHALALATRTGDITAMRRRWYTRIASAFLALWFVLCVTEPVAAMHRCPMHDGVAGVMAMPNGQTMGAAAHVPHGPDQPSPAHHDCTCIGDCAGASFAGLPAVSVALRTAAVQTVRMHPLAAPVVYPIPAPHARPFANGPPAIA